MKRSILKIIKITLMSFMLFGSFFNSVSTPLSAETVENITEENEFYEESDLTEINDAQDSEVNEHEELISGESRNNNVSIQPFSAGIASFDGVDLNGYTELSYTQAQIINIDKTVAINADFADTTSVGKKVTVQLKKEMFFQTVPGLKKTSTGFVYDPTTLPSNLQGFVSNITYTPNPTSADSWNGYGNVYSGTIVYEFIDSMTSTPLSFVTKIDRLYLTNNAGYSIEDAVTISIEKSGAVIQEESLEKLTYSSSLNIDLWRGGNRNVYEDQTTNLRTVVGTLTSAPDGLHGGLVEYYELTYAYSKELEYVSTEGTNIPNTGVIDTERWEDDNWKYVKIKFVNAKITGSFYLNFNVADTTNHVLGKVYNVKPSGNQIVKPYDRDAFERNKAASFTFTVTETYKNSAELIAINHGISLENADTGNVALGQISFRNLQVDELVDQTFKLTFDNVYIGVNRIDLLTASNTPTNTAYNISGTTTDGREFTLPDITVWSKRYNLTLNDSNIIPNDGEYIKTLVWTEKQIPGSFASYSSYLGMAGKARYYGDILASAKAGDIATSILQSVSVESGEDIHDTTNQVNLKITFLAAAGGLGYAGNGATVNMLSGETKTYNTSITWNDTQNNFVSSIEGFNFYLREADAYEFDISTFAATDSNGTIHSQANGNVIISTLTDNQGMKTYKISAPEFAFNFRVTVTYKVDLTTKKSAGNFTIQSNQVFFSEPMNEKINIMNMVSGYTNYDIYDVSDLRSETQQMFINTGTITNLAQADFSTATSANLDGGAWTTYDYDKGTTVLDLNPDGVAQYKLSVANNSGQNVNGYKAIIPIPKSGENAGTDFQRQDFEWDVLLNNPIDVSSTNYAYTVRYATDYTNDFDSTLWKTWNEITDKTTIKAVRIVTTDIIPDGGKDEITFNIDMDPITADLQAGGENIYNALIYRSVLGAEGAAPSEPVAIRLKTGVVKGQVFNDTNRDGLMNGTETGRNGVVVTAYETGTTNAIETKTTQTINGIPGSYAFLGLDKDMNVDITFTNPTNDDSIRFSTVTSGGSTPTPDANHEKATVVNVAPSATGYDSVDAGFITPITITFDAQGGVSSMASIKKYPGEQLTTEPTATKSGHTFNGWYTIATGGSPITLPYTIGNVDEVLYAQYIEHHYTAEITANDVAISLANVQNFDVNSTMLAAYEKEWSTSTLVNTINEVTRVVPNATELAAIKNATVAGAYPLSFEMVSTHNIVAQKSITVLVTNSNPNGEYAVTAQDFTVTLANVASADFIVLANAKGYKIQNGSIVSSTELVTLETAKPTTVGEHEVTFASNGATATVTVLVTNDNPNGEYAITAHDFTVTLANVASADFVTLANAKGYKLLNGTIVNDTELVTLETAKPTTVGRHEVTFASNGAIATVIVLVTNDDIYDRYAVTAEDFTVTLADVASADFVTLANAKGYKLLNGTIISDTELVTLETAKPTTVGLHQVTFVSNGASATVEVLVTTNIVPPLPGQTVIHIEANNFSVKDTEATSADYVTLAEAKGFAITYNDVGTITNIEQLAATMTTSPKPTTVGTHLINFVTAQGGSKNVAVSIYKGIAPSDKKVKIYTSIDTANVALDNLTGMDYATTYNITAFEEVYDSNDELISIDTIIPTLDTSKVTEKVGVKLIKITATGITSSDIATKNVQLNVTKKGNTPLTSSTTKSIAAFGVITTEVFVSANDFTIKLSDLASMTEEEMETLAYAFGAENIYDDGNFEDSTELTIADGSLTIDTNLLQALKTANKAGQYELAFTAEANGKTATERIIVTVTNDGSDPVIVGNAQVAASDVVMTIDDLTSADFVALAGASGSHSTYDVDLHLDTFAAVIPDMDTTELAAITKAGIYPLTFSVKNGTDVAEKTIKVIVSNALPINNEIVIAENFTVALADVTTADFILLANAKGYDITNLSTPIEIPVTEITARPTTVGTHTVRFETANGGYAEVQVLVTNEDSINDEAVIANDFTVALADVVTADFITLANAKGYNITDPTTPIEIPVTEITARPTTVGTHTVRFETANGGYAEVNVTVTEDGSENSYRIDANNISLDLDTFKENKNNGTLTDYIISASEAKVIEEKYNVELDGANITVQHDELLGDNIKVNEKYNVTLHFNPETHNSNTTINYNLSEEEMNQAMNTSVNIIQKEITVTITGQDTLPQLPVTGQNIIEIIFVGLLVFGTSLLIFLVQYRRKNRI